MKIHPGRFAGRRAVITGAGSGIGRATALRLGAEGGKVALIALEKPPLEEVAAEIKASGGDALVLKADCTVEQEIAGAIDTAANAWGGLDIVVANAGIELVGKDDRIDLLTLEIWQRLITTNLTGQFLTCKHGARHLLATGGGAIVCLGSNCGHLGMAPKEPAYSASKGGILGMMKVMAMDYSRMNIRVNMVVPGFINTPMNDPVLANPEEAEFWMKQIPIGRAGVAEECAAAILWLASDEASYCVGTALVVDGGASSL